ncbi:MAG TPA: hypothetical protein VHN79_00885 [Lacunisphaera sp.]|nr:hypothetical protein [Lacunisphaera sp.]
MKQLLTRLLLGATGACAAVPCLKGDGTVSTVVYARAASDYRREQARDGSFEPEYYALSNGGRIFGTASDDSVDRVTYPQVAEVAMRLLSKQNYRYARTREQAKLLVVLQWGTTIAPNSISYGLSVNHAAAAYADLVAVTGPQGMGSIEQPGERILDEGADPGVKVRFETAMLRLLADNRVRDQLNERNARVLGYLDELADANDIRRWAGGGDRYNDLIGDVEESRYFMVISAYDFPGLLKEKKKLLWQVRVSVRGPGNSFDDSFVAMLKEASKHFGQHSGRLIRGEESKGTVGLGDLKFLGEAQDPAAQKAPAAEKQK